MEMCSVVAVKQNTLVQLRQNGDSGDFHPESLYWVQSKITELKGKKRCEQNPLSYRQLGHAQRGEAG